MAKYEQLKARRRDDYQFFLEYRTRWADNDQYAPTIAYYLHIPSCRCWPLY